MTKLNFLIVCCCLIATTLFSQKLKFSTFLISDELKEDANAVIRMDNMAIEMTSQSNMTIVTEMAITVFNKRADHYSDISVSFDKNRHLKSFKGYVYDAMGNQIEKIRKSDFDEYSGSGSSLYTDNKFYNFDYTPTTYPYTIYYKYEVQTSNTAFIPRWFAVGGYYQSVERASFSFVCPSDINLHTLEKNFDGFNIEVDKGLHHISYTTENIKAIEQEPSAPSFSKIAPNARLGVNKFNLERIDGEAENWSEFGLWRYQNLNNGNGEIHGPIVNQIKKLVIGVDDPIERAKIVYEFVQNKVRYISVQEGIGGWKPITADEVHNTSYGDCKGLTNYTKTLLSVVNVPSNYTVLWGGNEKIDIEKEVFSMQGNHVILNIPNGDENIWLECTTQDMPFGEIAGFTDDRDVLVITPQGGKIVHTRVYEAKENTQSIKGSYIIESNGNIEAEVEVIYKGNQYDNHLGIETSNNKDKEKLYKEFWDNINNMTLHSIDVKNNKKVGQFEEKIAFTATNYGTVSGNRMIIPLNAFNVIGRAPKRVRNRKLPVEISRGFYDTDEVTIKLPSDYTIEAIADDVSVDTKYGTYTMTVEKIDEHNLKFTRKFLLKAGDYPKEDYEHYRNFRRKVVKGDKSKIVLVKK
ncbi:MAG: DUF3857 domain-containing protein [Flavobacteriaceae bacterium]